MAQVIILVFYLGLYVSSSLNFKVIGDEMGCFAILTGQGHSWATLG